MTPALCDVDARRTSTSNMRTISATARKLRQCAVDCAQVSSKKFTSSNAETFSSKAFATRSTISTLRSGLVRSMSEAYPTGSSAACSSCRIVIARREREYAMLRATVACKGSPRVYLSSREGRTANNCLGATSRLVASLSTVLNFAFPCFRSMRKRVFRLMPAALARSWEEMFPCVRK